jgi:hypothetical protein
VFMPGASNLETPPTARQGGAAWNGVLNSTDTRP